MMGSMAWGSCFRSVATSVGGMLTGQQHQGLPPRLIRGTWYRNRCAPYMLRSVYAYMQVRARPVNRAKLGPPRDAYGQWVRRPFIPLGIAERAARGGTGRGVYLHGIRRIRPTSLRTGLRGLE